jgi:drug/metabolite transporter (DMT)-like permease
MNLPADQTVSVTVQLLTAGVVLGASTLATGTAKSTNVGDLPATVWAALGFLTFFSTLVGYGLFTWLNTTASSTLANTYNYVSPVIAICLAASFLHEPLSCPKAGAAIVALLGVALMVTGSTAKAGSLDAPSRWLDLESRCSSQLQFVGKPIHYVGSNRLEREAIEIEPLPKGPA